MISIKGTEPDSKKLASVTAYHTLHNSKEVKQFIGLSNYYCCFMAHYAEIVEPLHRLLRKTSKNFNWTAECDISFSLLKAKLTSPPILAYCNLPINSHGLYSSHPRIIASGCSANTIINATTLRYAVACI